MRPPVHSPEFREYFEGVVKSSRDVHEATKRLGYAIPTTVLHHMKRLGIRAPDQWNARPLPTSPEFRSYFENVVKTSQSMGEAVERLGYTRPQSVRYNLKRFGMAVPDHWYSKRHARELANEPGFANHFRQAVESSENVWDAMKMMGYGSPNSVWYYMKKLDIRTPNRWHGRPAPRGPDFAAYFEDVVNTSKTVKEAVQRLNYANTCMIYYHIKRLGLKVPERWGLKPWVGVKRSERIPKTILQTEKDASWVGALHQGEGCLTCRYVKLSDVTVLAVVVAMTDSAPIFHLSDLFGIGRPQRPKPRPSPLKPIWVTAVHGLRAYRVMQEILPYLMGQKLAEAKRALEFFGPAGYREGRYSPYDIWPESEFPLRKRGVTRLAQGLLARLAASGIQLNALHEGLVTPKLDTICLRIADVLLEVGPTSLGLVEIMDRSGASWTAVVHHLKHLEDNSLVVRERVPNPGRRGPRLTFKANHKLAELRELGWIPDTPGDSAKPTPSP